MIDIGETSTLNIVCTTWLDQNTQTMKGEMITPPS